MTNFFSEETDNQGRPIAIGVFIILVGFFVLASNVIPMPQRDRVDRSLDLIMLEAIAMAEAVELEEEEAELPAEEDFSEPEKTSSENFDDLMSAFTELTSLEVIEEDATLLDRGETESLALRSDVGIDFGAEGSLDLFGNRRFDDSETDLVSQKRGEQTWTLRPNIVSGSVGSSNSRLSAGVVSETDLTGRSGRPERLVEAIIGEWDESVSLTSEEIARKNAVVRWMQERLNDLDRPVRTLFQQNPRDLTVNELILIGARTYHLQMMYSPVTRTLHIAWIDEDEIYYFVDPALQFRINYFEEGIVERVTGTEVVLLETEELSAQSPQAIREYQIFLNWWKPQIESSQDG